MRVIIPLLLLCAGCAADLPEAQRTLSPAAQAAEFPVLVPIGPLLHRAQSGSTVVAARGDLQTRAVRLRQRAAALQGRSVLDGKTRLRLLNATR